MTDTNANKLRTALAKSFANAVKDSGLSNKLAAEKAGVNLSRFYQVIAGNVKSVSSDALVNMLGEFGYTVVVSGGDEIVLTLDKAEKALPEIQKPVAIIEPDQNNADFGPDTDRVVAENE